MTLILLPEGAAYPESNITAADVYSQMGASAEAMKGSPTNQYYLTAYLTMANIAHGSAAPTGYINKLATPGPIQNSYWDAGAPWVQVISADANTCTNARFIVANAETYILRHSTGKWEKLAENDGTLVYGLDKYVISTYSVVGAATKKVAGIDNSWSFNDYSGGTYNVLHNAFHRKVPLPGGGADLAGLFVTAKVKLVDENGGTSFTGTCKKYASLGFDFWPTMDSSLSGDMAFKAPYTGGEYNPGSGSSQFVLVPTDGSWLRLYYIPYVAGGAFIDTNSAYHAAHGTAGMTFTAAQIAANPPILLPNMPFKRSGMSNHVLADPIAGVAHEINGVLASSEAQTVMRQSFAAGGALLSSAVKAALPDTGMPVIESVTETAFALDATAHAVSMPATVNAGDCLIAGITVDGAPTITTPTGWKRYYSNANGTDLKGAMYAKVADGTEGGTTVNFATDSAENMAAQVFRISNWNGTLAGIQVGTSAQTSTGTTVDLPAVTFYWGSSNTLCIGMCHSSTSQTVSSSPTDYTSSLRTSSADATTGAQIITARRSVTAASEDPGVFTFSGITGASTVYNTIAIAPANAGLYYEHFNITSGLDTLWLGLYATQSTTVSDPSITRAIIVCHGTSLSPDEYGNVVRKNMENYLGNTIVIAPFFAESSNWPETGQIYWGSSIWPELGDSSGSLAFTVSSGTVLDNIIARLYSTFTNLEGIILAGHSAGGQLVNRYSAASSDTRNRYLVSAASSYVYLDGNRANAFGGWTVATSPSTFDDWKYGLSHLTTAASTYVQDVGVYNLRHNLLNAKVTYMVGALDNDPADTSMDLSADAALQGTQRVERQSNYYAHIQYYYGYIV